MSAFFVVTDPDPERQQALARTLAKSLATQGFERPRTFTLPEGQLTWYESPGNPGSIDQCCSFDAGFIVCVGTLFYRGQSGAAALRAFWDAFETAGSADSIDLSGEYQVVLRKHRTTWAFGDALGMIKLYEAPRVGVLSTSWLACLAVAPDRDLDPVGVLDYIFSGANHGARTPCEQVRIADPARVLNLSAGRREAVFDATFWQPGSLFSDEAQAIDLIADRLTRLATLYTSRTGKEIKCALSGGFDSRLILATLLNAGAQPRLHVYGSADNEDVVIARMIDQAMHLGLRCIDKKQLDAELVATGKPDLTSNLHFFDGIPIDGILDDGSDRTTRLNQARDGALALNGGGEVLRNFFYLPDRPFTAPEIVSVFYSG